MVSSEKADSGSGRSHFSQTCTLLSQYLKENGSFGDLNHSLTPQGKFSFSNLSFLGKIAGKENGQMTIFYSGKVVVLDDIPANKAKEIMTLATTYSAPPQSNKPSVAHDLPIARKNSLARFLEKRKDRITGTAPYQANKSALKAEPWMELGSQLPLPN